MSYPGNPADPSSLSFLSPFPLFAYCWYVSLMCSVRVYSARPQAAVTTQAENFSFWLLPFLLSDYLMPLLFIYIYIYKTCWVTCVVLAFSKGGRKRGRTTPRVVSFRRTQPTLPSLCVFAFCTCLRRPLPRTQILRQWLDGSALTTTTKHEKKNEIEKKRSRRRRNGG